MPMLRDIMEKVNPIATHATFIPNKIQKITLIDYELLKNKDQQRLVMFGKHAGYAGN
jgi:hypothetical protein